MVYPINNFHENLPKTLSYQANKKYSGSRNSTSARMLTLSLAVVDYPAVLA